MGSRKPRGGGCDSCPPRNHGRLINNRRAAASVSSCASRVSPRVQEAAPVIAEGFLVPHRPHSLDGLFRLTAAQTEFVWQRIKRACLPIFPRGLPELSITPRVVDGLAILLGARGRCTQ